MPPCYELFKPDVTAPLARKLAETYNLKSTALLVNQNAASTQYLSFRHILKGEPFRYIDSAIGIDQIEITFSNPATISELKDEAGSLWNIVIESLQPSINENYFNATLHCESESSTKAFLNELVNIQTKSFDIRKGFSLWANASNATARIGLEVSDFIPDGLFVVFEFFSKETVRNAAAFGELFEAALNMYRSMQTLANVDLVEPT